MMSERKIRAREACEQASDLPDNLHPVIRRILLSRGITRKEQLSRELKDMLLPDSLGGIDQAAAIVAIVFGAVTVVSGGRALFGDAQAQAALGDIVPFVLWFNFAAGFAYVLAGIGLFLMKRRAAQLAVLIAVATALVFVGLGIHVVAGGAYEMRTVAAMALRTGLWTVIALFACRALGWRAPKAAGP